MKPTQKYTVNISKKQMWHSSIPQTEVVKQRHQVFNIKLRKQRPIIIKFRHTKIIIALQPQTHAIKSSKEKERINFSATKQLQKGL